MKDRFQAVAETGIPFFGKVTASLSHEIRNVLATIYENAGLMEDLLALAEKGRPLEPHRIRDLAGKMKGQVRRGREIIDRLSLLAHSSDESEAPVDLKQVLGLAAGLGERIALMRGVTLRPVLAGDPVIVATNPFVLGTLIWLCIELALGAKLAEKTLTMIPELRGKTACIRFEGFEEVHVLIGSSGFLELQTCAQKCGAEVTVEEGSGEILLSMLLDAKAQ